jgi:hypothetical protein
LHRGPLSAAIPTALAYAILLAAAPYSAHGDWTFGAEAQVRHDNNVGNGEYYPDVVSDTIVAATLSAFQLFPIGEGFSLTAGANLSGEHYNQIDGLSNATVGGTLALKKKWGLGAFAPWARIGVSIARQDFSDNYRDASIYRETLAAGQRIDERWNFWAEYANERRSVATQEVQEPGVSGDAFSQSSRSLAANVEYSLRERTHLTFGLLFRHGDVVSTSSGDYDSYYAARAIADDPAFGPDAYAYRLTGTTFGFKAGANYSPTTHSLVGFDFQRLDTRADGGGDYTKSVLEITLDYVF